MNPWMRMFARAALAALASGCVSTAEDSQSPSRGEPATEPTHIALAQSVRPSTRVPVPPGFRAIAHGSWSRMASPDGRSRIVEGPVEADVSLVASIKEAAGVAGATSVELADEQTIALGEEALPAQAVDGRCQVDGEEMRVAGASIDGGDGRRLLVVHVFARDISEETLRAALGAIGALRHR